MKRTDKYQLYAKKYKASESLVDGVYNLDKTPTKKYVPYLLLHHTSGTCSCYDLLPLVEDFEKLLPYIENKDIYSREYTSIRYLKDVLAKASLAQIKKQNFKEKSNDIFVLKETDDYIMLQPRTHQASMKYGYGTRWCTTQRENPRYFQSYSKYLVYVIFKNASEYDRNRKVAFHARDGVLKRIDMYDVTDDCYDIHFFISYDPKFKQIIKTYKRFINRAKFLWFKKLIPNSFAKRDYDYIQKEKERKRWNKD